MDTIPEPILVYKDSDETIPYSKVVVPSSMRSPLWRYFGFPADENNVIIHRKKIVCCICGTQIAYNKNTTNLSTHLHCKHPTIYAEFNANAQKKGAPKEETEPNDEVQSKRVKRGDDINVDWYVDENTQIEQIKHPTGIRAKESIKHLNASLGMFDDERTKQMGTKKSMILDENFELVITSEVSDRDNQFIETLDYNSKDYLDMVNDNCDDMLRDPENLVEVSDGGDTGKNGFLANEFLKSLTHTSSNTFEEAKAHRNSIKINVVSVKAPTLLKANSSTENIRKRLSEDKSNTDITGQLKSFIVKDIASPAVLDGVGFKELIQTLAGNSAIPTASEVEESLTDDYEQQHTETISTVRKIIGEQQYSISFNQLKANKLYAISINYLVGDNMHFEMLETRNLYVSESIADFFECFELNSSKCSAFVTNFVSNDDCVDHIASFAAEKDIPVIQTFCSIISDAVAECMNKSIIREALDAVQLNQKCRNISWLEQFEYLSELLEASLTASDEVSEFMPSIEHFVSCLRPLKNCLDVLALESITFASLMRPIALELLNQHYKNVNESKIDEHPLQRDLKQIISNTLEKKIIENKFLAMASFLDPRFQGLSLPADLPSIRDYIGKSLEVENSISNRQQSAHIKPENKSGHRNSGLSSLFANITSSTKSKMPRNRFDMEFRSYTEDVNLDMDQCPLKWWSESEFLYPNIKRYVEQYFCVPAFGNICHLLLSMDKQIELRQRCDTITTETDRMILWLHLNQMR